ncbi:MAG: ABC transporter permease [Bacteroidales bacterium]|nr:ABC transporter permease [Bacteroidales bacterium]
MFEFWLEVKQTITRNKWRSIMTAFGVFWGLLMLMILVGIGNGVNDGIMGALTTVPSNSLIYGGSMTTMPYKGFGRDRFVQLDNEDVGILETRLEDYISFVTPVNQAGSMAASHGEHSYKGATVIGSNANYLKTFPQKMLFGRNLNEIDIRERRKNCVIGNKVYKALFPKGENPCGELVQVNGIYYTVVGVFEALSSAVQIMGDDNETFLLPITTEQLCYNQGNSIAMIFVTFKDEYDASKMKDMVFNVHRPRHYVHPDDKNAFWAFDLAEIINMFRYLFLGIEVLLWIVGCGSLLAGLVGISNIMLVTVKERTQEIGIRRALGAKPRTILTQILAESLVLTTAAGMVGLMLGTWILQIISMVNGGNINSEDNEITIDPSLDFDLAITALIVILIGGLLAGWMPANRAMKIKAIDALRDE